MTSGNTENKTRNRSNRRTARQSACQPTLSGTGALLSASLFVLSAALPGGALQAQQFDPYASIYGQQQVYSRAPYYREVQRMPSQPMGQWGPRHQVWQADAISPVQPPQGNGTSPYDPRNRVTITNEPVTTLPMYGTDQQSSAGNPWNSPAGYRYPASQIPGSATAGARYPTPYPAHEKATVASARGASVPGVPTGIPPAAPVTAMTSAPPAANVAPVAASNGQAAAPSAAIPVQTAAVAPARAVQNQVPANALSLADLAASGLEGAGQTLQAVQSAQASGNAAPRIPVQAQPAGNRPVTSLPRNVSDNRQRPGGKTRLDRDIAAREAGFAPGDLPYITPSEGWRLDAGGQMNMAVIHGRASGLKETFLGDNSHDPSSGMLRLAKAYSDDLIVGAQLQGGLRFNPSDKVYLQDADVTGNIYADLMRAEAFVASRKFGRFWLGHGSMASDGMTGVDLSGTDVVTGVNNEAIGAMFTQDKSITGVHGSTGTEVVYGESYHAYNGLGLAWRARYDSPNWRGFNLSVGTDFKGNPDAALRWSGAFGRTRFKAALGVASGVDSEKETDNTNWGMSFSSLFPWGTNVTFAYGTTDPMRSISNNTSQTEFVYYGKLGQQFKLFDFGVTAFSLDYGFSSTYRRANEDIEKYGLALVQHIEPAAMDVYISFHTADLDEDDTYVSGRSEVNETQTLVVGTKVTF